MLDVPAVQYFQDEIDRVDITCELTFELDANYEFDQWSYEGLHVIGGSNNAVELGFSALLHKMGFNWFAPFDPTLADPPFVNRPDSINKGLKEVKQAFPLRGLSLTPTYDVANWTHAPFDQDTTLLKSQHHRWSVLNGTESSRFQYTSGHRWAGVVLSDPEFWAANPRLLRAGDKPNSRRFNLPFMAYAQTRMFWDTCVEACAAYLLYEGLNESGSTFFDPTDGNQDNAELVCRFTNDVALKVREGTGPIGKYEAQDAVPNAVLRILAYSKHSFPPETRYSETITAQVTAAYNGLPVETLIVKWKEKVADVSLYDYWDLPPWHFCVPISSQTTKASYCDGWLFPLLMDNKIPAIQSESSGNWLTCMVLHHQAVSFAREGPKAFADALNEIVEQVFDGSAEVWRLFEMWAEEATFMHPWTLKESFDLVASLPPDTPNRLALMQVLVIAAQTEDVLALKRELPDRNWLAGRVPIEDTSQPEYDLAKDSAREKLKILAGQAFAVRKNNIFHSYGLHSAMLNSGLIRDHYPELWLRRPGQQPDWMRPDCAVEPTMDDFASQHAIVTSRAPDPAVDLVPHDKDKELVLLTGLSSQWQGEKSSRSDYVRLQHSPLYSRAQLRFIVKDEPGTVTISNSAQGASPTVTPYSVGVHDFTARGDSVISYEGGHLFLAGFPPVSTAVDADEYFWLWVPSAAEDETIIHTTGNLAVRREMPIPTLNFSHGSNHLPKTLGSGQLTIIRSATSGQMTILRGASPWLSLDSSVALVPRRLVPNDNFEELPSQLG